MTLPPTDSALELAFPRTIRPGVSASPLDLEGEIINLFDQFRNRLLRYVLSLGLSAHDGEEVIQEVFLSLFTHLRLGKSRRNLRGWIFRVAHNLALKQRQANQRTRCALGTDDMLAERQLDTDPGPEEQLASSQRQRRLLAVLHALPEMDQQCLRLRAEGLRYREIAEVLGISLGSVSILLTRSLARLERADER